jgi:hypothetical protein
MTALLASLASPALAAGPDEACTSGRTLERAAHAAACAIDPAPALAAPIGIAASDGRDGLAIDCSPLALGGLVSGPGTGGLHASQLVDATIRHCSRRGFVYGLARHAPGPGLRLGAQRLG